MEFDRLAVDADRVDPEIRAAVGLFALLDAQGGKRQALRLIREFQADGIVAVAGDLRFGRGHALGGGAPVLAGPGGVRVHQISGVHAVFEEGEVDLHGLDGGESFLVHDDGGGAFGIAVIAAAVGGHFGDPFVVDVHAGLDAVVGGGVALGEFDRLAVDADRVDPEIVAGEQGFAVLDAQGGEGQALRFIREFQADRVVARAGDHGVVRGHAFRLGRPVLDGPAGIRVHDVGQRFGRGFSRRFFSRGFFGGRFFSRFSGRFGFFCGRFGRFSRRLRISGGFFSRFSGRFRLSGCLRLSSRRLFFRLPGAESPSGRAGNDGQQKRRRQHKRQPFFHRLFLLAVGFR